MSGPVGPVVGAGPEGMATALRILVRGGEIDYGGASGSMGWDGDADPSRRHIGIWRLARDERMEDAGAMPFER